MSVKYSYGAGGGGGGEFGRKRYKVIIRSHQP